MSELYLDVVLSLPLIMQVPTDKVLQFYVGKHHKSKYQ